jgi:hypothetical protein
MGTGVTRRQTGVSRHQNDDRFDNLFFSGMAVVILVSVFVGFAHSYYLAGVFKAPLPNLLVHIHGAVFSCWIVLLIVQTSLVAASRVDLHRRMGLLGFALACLVVILGLLAAIDSLGRHFAPGEAGMSARAFSTVTLTTMLAFSTLIYFAFRNRFNPAAHKRLIVIGTIALLDAAFVRWPVPAQWWGLRAASFLCTIPLLLLIMGYDYWSRGKVHRATIWASVFVVVLQQLRDPIGYSAPWQVFTQWVQIHARSLHI